jgi:peptidoglycan/LPS O-acetylase OafA/YrhL
MLRTLAGIIVGFLVMAVLVVATFGITMAVLGMDNILKPGAYWTTDTFNIIVLAGGVLAAIVGGMVCKLITRDSKATLALAAIVLALGAVSAVTNMNRPDPPARTGTPTITDIQTHGKEPTWFGISKTVLAVAGIVVGSSLVKRARATP